MLYTDEYNRFVTWHFYCVKGVATNKERPKHNRTCVDYTSHNPLRDLLARTIPCGSESKCSTGMATRR